MKYLFAIIAVGLILLSIAQYHALPDTRTDRPILYWVTDANPERQRQVAGFHEWLVENGHITPDGRPVVELRLDFGNNDLSKKIIQGVSGVGAAIWDVYNGGRELHFFHASGLLVDVTEHARRLGYGLDKTYPAMESEICIDGRQYAFPCNVSASMLWVNLATLRRYGFDAPPTQWTFEAFERFGKAYVAKANADRPRKDRFFLADIETNLLYRSLGLSIFNETLTRCTLDDPRYVRALQLKHKWIYEDRLLPSLADRHGFDTQAGYGGPTLQLFMSGNYAMFASGRYALIQLRKFGNHDLAVVHPPYGQYPTTSIIARSAVIYVGGDHVDKAALFQAYLASERYNMLIVRDADALPPNPQFTRTEAYKHPPEHPNEWGIHEAFADIAQTIAIGGAYSPFVLPNVVDRRCKEAEDAFMAGVLTAEEAAAQVTARINAEIDLTLREQPNLRQRYDQLLSDQRQIDQLRDAGKPIPLRLIRNPFYRRYYKDMGWAQ